MSAYTLKLKEEKNHLLLKQRLCGLTRIEEKRLLEIVEMLNRLPRKEGGYDQEDS